MEKGNRKKREQQRDKFLKPQPKVQRKAVVTIKPDAKIPESKVSIDTGSVSDLEMYKYLSDMAKHFATVLCQEAGEVVGDDPDDQIKYLNWRIEQSGINH
ncbi:hypothetical protein [Aquimarina sp. 2201CG5-10]|uniref:hypothetical protein n=1 Tax=Aquimarina callyspongiae TaxID=3098150 RepID=UPI002AB3E55C|nr:hypothetical protein [Aquimarina sp. 2201CG5-10]MDY8137589.1 hypothetical protein [Aquimarina sp. 2201CG5-10]